MLNRDIINAISPEPCAWMPEYQEPASPEGSAMYVLNDEDIDKIEG